MNQIPIQMFDPAEEAPARQPAVVMPKTGQFFLLTAVLQIGGGLAFGGYEWHEKYIARLPDYCHDHEQLLTELMAVRPFNNGRIIPTGAGKRIRIGDAQIFFTQQKLATTLAKLMLENKVLPLLVIKDKAIAA